MGNYQNLIKPIIDRAVGVVVLTSILPILVCIIITLLIVYKENPFFLQRRIGRGGRVFNIVKLKTMRDNKNSSKTHLSDHERITRLGYFLRSTSLDELPQLINVIKGEMSVVGPRPLLEEYLPLYSPFQRQRHKVLPGITGWAQVNGRNLLSWEERLKLDVWYVHNMSLRVDLLIAGKTFLRLTNFKMTKKETSLIPKFKGS